MFIASLTSTNWCFQHLLLFGRGNEDEVTGISTASMARRIGAEVEISATSLDFFFCGGGDAS
jgi:hypothetical protein